MGTTSARKQPRPVEYDVEDDALYDTRPPNSIQRYRPVQPVHHDTEDEPLSQGTLIQRRRSSLGSQHPTSGIASNAVAPARLQARSTGRRFPIVALLVGMVVTVLLIMTLSAFLSWWHVYQDDLHYGRPRTSQLDAVVGHDDSAQNPTHFIFINMNRHVMIFEIPGGDPSRTRVYSGPVLYGDGQDLTPVTGEIRDVNGDGKSDLIVHIGDQQVIFINTGTTFQPQSS